MEMYKVITEVRLKDVLEHSALTDFNSSSADLKSWWWIRRVRGKKSIRLLSAWKTSSSNSSLGRTRQKSQRECVANLDLSSVLHTGVEPRWRPLLENNFAGDGTSSDNQMQYMVFVARIWQVVEPDRRLHLHQSLVHTYHLNLVISVGMQLTWFR